MAIVFADCTSAERRVRRERGVANLLIPDGDFGLELSCADPTVRTVVQSDAITDWLMHCITHLDHFGSPDEVNLQGSW